MFNPPVSSGRKKQVDMNQIDCGKIIAFLIVMLLIVSFGWISSQSFASKFGKELITTRIELIQCQTELKSAYQLLLRGR